MKQEVSKVRYAVVGLGYIAQSAVLPAFKNVQRNSELAALVSDDPAKLRSLGKKYRVEGLYSYAEYKTCLETVDAVYIALPNSMHRQYSIAAAERGVHVLCEKPLAVTVADCNEMIRKCAIAKVKLMTAYRLHFDPANLNAVETVRSGKLGDPQIFNSVFSMQVKPDNIRVKRNLGGGPLYDIGIYCINAARYLFRSEPKEVFCWTAKGDEKRFRQVERTASAILRFDGEQIASFTCSFGAADSSAYTLIGSKGRLDMENAYEIAAPMKQVITAAGKSRTRTFNKTDQFAPELLYFSDCVLTDRNPEPSGEEGLADVRVIEALHKSASTGRAMILPAMKKRARPSRAQEYKLPAAGKPRLVKASPGHD